MKIGMQELLIVFIVALIVLGPDKLPLYARKFGEALREFRKFSSEATKDIRESIVEPLEEAQRPLREALEPITELEKEVRSDMEGIQKSFSDIGKQVKEEREPSAAVADSEAPDVPESEPESETAAGEAAERETGESHVPTVGSDTLDTGVTDVSQETADSQEPEEDFQKAETDSVPENTPDVRDSIPVEQQMG